MFNKIIKSVLVGVCMLSLGSMVHAVEIDLNVYGASAQYTFWSNEDGAFLQGIGCNAADIYKSTNGSNQTVTFCAGTDGAITDSTGKNYVGGGINASGAIAALAAEQGDTLVLRYASKASYDGIYALMGQDPYATNSPDSAAPACVPTPNGCAANQRQLAEPSTSTFASFPAAGVVGALGCEPIYAAASDVAATTFNQVSTGVVNGPAGGCPVNGRVVAPIDPPDQRTVAPITVPGTYTHVSKLIVPFALWVNTSLTPANLGANAGVWDISSNVTRLQAIQLFSGTISDWSQIGVTANVTPIVICHRHAGSGSLATLDAAIMRGDESSDTNQTAYVVGVSPTIWTNDGTSQELSCVSTQANSIGYADADHSVPANTKQTDYMGAAATSQNLKLGIYDYWTNEELYYTTNAGNTNHLNAAQTAVMNQLVSFISVDANMPASEAAFWATPGTMGVSKQTDFQYPHR